MADTLPIRTLLHYSNSSLRSSAHCSSLRSSQRHVANEQREIDKEKSNLSREREKVNADLSRRIEDVERKEGAMMEKEAELIAHSDAEDQRLHAKENELTNMYDKKLKELHAKEEQMDSELERQRNALHEDKAKIHREGLEKAEELRLKEASLEKDTEAERTKLANLSVSLNEESERIKVAAEKRISEMKEEVRRRVTEYQHIQHISNSSLRSSTLFTAGQGQGRRRQPRGAEASRCSRAKGSSEAARRHRGTERRPQYWHPRRAHQQGGGHRGAPHDPH